MSDNAASEYYIQNGYVGNAVAWWRKGGAGYTTEINHAERFSEHKAIALINDRQDFKAWKCSHVDENIAARKMIIDSQYLDSQFEIRNLNK